MLLKIEDCSGFPNTKVRGPQLHNCRGLPSGCSGVAPAWGKFGNGGRTRRWGRPPHLSPLGSENEVQSQPSHRLTPLRMCVSAFIQQANFMSIELGVFHEHFMRRTGSAAVNKTVPSLKITCMPKMTGRIITNAHCLGFFEPVHTFQNPVRIMYQFIVRWKQKHIFVTWLTHFTLCIDEEKP